MSFSNNPQSVFNGFVSVSRNVYLTSSIALAVYSYSNSFKLSSSDISIRLISVSIFIFALLILVNGTISFNNYLENLKKENNNHFPYYVDVNAWKRFVYINIIYAFLIIVIFLLSSRRTFNKIFS